MWGLPCPDWRQTLRAVRPNHAASDHPVSFAGQTVGRLWRDKRAVENFHQMRAVINSFPHTQPRCAQH